MEDARGQATDALAEIVVVERRTRAAVAYRRASAFLILWGALVAIGAGLNQIFSDRSEVIWYGVDAIGLVGTCVIALRRARDGALDRTGWEIIASFFVLGAYGVAWSHLLAPAGHDRLAVFWSTLMMMGYAVAGLWRGPLFAVCGLIGTVLSFTAFFFAGPWLHLWIGAIYAFGFVLGGLWLDRLGAGE
ncbi:hypothetical protein [Methylocystis suflitae]|uniref:hypothetical protein n=1 Tax=Methylocystis suflitae TaxID=2951405 RepID=UPI00210BDE48|nr:hypothetical protein [Methylocystis suflitae]MCQ4189414.1 hypothetical protein [Methylocystis suflitae]